MIKSFKKDFPIFRNNPGLVFLDSTATTQKPDVVIDGIKNYLEESNSSIHRGMYEISEVSEKKYVQSKKKVAEFINCDNYKEIIYTYNSTYALNILSSSIGISNILKKGDKVLLSIAEHHANIVPWLILKERIGFDIEYIQLDENYNLDMQDFDDKYDENVKIISMTHISNVTGQIFDLEAIGNKKREDTLFIVDASQSIAHSKVDIKKINCDFLFFTGHKIFSDTGIGVLWGKKDLLENLKPSFSGGGSIGKVTTCEFTNAAVPEKFEFGTPNVSGAISLYYGLKYFQDIGGYEYVEKYEDELSEYFLNQLNSRKSINLIGSRNLDNRIGVFTMYVEGFHSHDFADLLAEKNIAVRSGKHCAHPLFAEKGITHSFRVSLFVYNTKEDIDKFFEGVDEILKFKGE